MTAQTTTAPAAPATVTSLAAPRSAVRAILRAEGLPILIAGAFVPLLLAPDLSAIGYVRGTRLGSITYNLAHNLVTAGALLGLGLSLGIGWLAIAGSVAVAHIGMDRLAGYGLKYPTTFKDTYFQHV
jgi:Domain of unknown function (DUF4260)